MKKSYSGVSRVPKWLNSPGSHSTKLLSLCMILLFSSSSIAQTRDEKVRQDWQKLTADGSWYYDDLDAGIAVARKKKKPLMVVIRCIP